MTYPGMYASQMPNGGAMPNLPPGLNAANQSNPGTNTPAADVTPQTNKGTFSPPFRMGLGKSGVFSDPRQQIAGGPSADLAAPVQPATTDANGGASSSAGSIANGGATTPPPTSSNTGGGLPYDPNMNNPGGETAQQNQQYLNSLGSNWRGGG